MNRAAIRMTDEEALAFLESEKTVICATNGHDGFPHLMPLWYVVRDGTLWAWTYAKAQKTKNLERDPRATLQVEAGDSYDQLRGLMLRTEAVIHRDDATKLAFVEQLAARYARQGLAPDEAARRARVTFGGAERFKEEVRDARGGRWRDDLARDVRVLGRAKAHGERQADLTHGLGVAVDRRGAFHHHAAQFRVLVAGLH